MENYLLKALTIYKESFFEVFSTHKSFILSEEESFIKRILDFATSNNNCFERSCLEGHVTGSAMVVSKDYKKIVLTHHRKLGKWLQLGGHSDGNPLTFEVAMQEAKEESGLESLQFLNWLPFRTESQVPFDLDIHLIPENKSVPAHFHYDLRYLIVASDEHLKISDESNDLRWVELKNASELTTERSMLRQFDKLELILLNN